MLFNEAKSHLPKAHLPTSKRKVTSRLAQDICEDQGKLEKVETEEQKVIVILGGLVFP